MENRLAQLQVSDPARSDGTADLVQPIWLGDDIVAIAIAESCLATGFSKFGLK
jgi:hypothetical protein